jgi:ferric-dicitrate binding protein FerR (iron transport regulator)
MLIGVVMRLRLQLCIWFLFSGLFFNLLAQNEIRKCCIKSMIGSVKIRRGTAATWIDARPDMPLREKDAIKTFIESEVELETTEGTSLKVGENSTIEMVVFLTSGENQNTKIRIVNGSLMLKVKKFVTTRSRFEFETPISTATIKGTIVGFNVSEEKTVIKVCEGNVIVSSEGLKSTVVLKENQMALIGKGQKGISIEKLVENKKDQSNKERDSNKVNSTGVFEK